MSDHTTETGNKNVICSSDVGTSATTENALDEPDGLPECLPECFGISSKKKKKIDADEKDVYKSTSTTTTTTTTSGAVLTSPQDQAQPTTTSEDCAKQTKHTCTGSIKESVKEIPRYSFNQKYRGLAIVITQEKFSNGNHRAGAWHDGLRAEGIFKKFGYSVKSFKNQNHASFEKILKWASTTDHGERDSFAFAMFTHGGFKEHSGENKNEKESRELFQTCDCKTFETRQLIDEFKDSKCPSLKGKPRLFFIQACRGDKSSKSATVYTQSGGHGDNPKSSFAKDNDGFIDLPKALADMALVTEKDLPDTTDFEEDLKNHSDELTDDVADTPDARPDPAVPGGDTPDPSSFPNSQIPSVTANTVVSTQPYVLRPIPGYKDFLILYASPPGIYAFKKGKQGTPFAMYLYEEMFIKFDEDRPLNRMITEAVGQMAIHFQTYNPETLAHHGIKQVMCLNSMLTGEIYFKNKPVH